MTVRRIAPILVAAIGLAAGCTPTAGNRSPTPEQDPERYARAQQEAEAVLIENQEAEARFFRRIGLDPAEDVPESLDEPEITITSTEEGPS